MQKLLWTAAIATVLTVFCIVVVDDPLARWLATRETYPKIWNEVIHYLEYPLLIEPYKWTGVYVVVIGAIACLFIKRLRFMAPAWVLVALVHLASRNISLWMKTLTGRLRPSQWLSRGGDQWFRDGGFSFPSGHVLLFAGVILPLWIVYPRTRPLLAVVAFSMIARVVVNAHFVSDVTGALAVMAAATWVCAKAVRRALPSQILPPSLR